MARRPPIQAFTILVAFNVALLSPETHARGSSRRKAQKPAVSPAAPAPQPVVTEAPVELPASPGALVEQAQARYESLEYDQVITLVTPALARDDITVEQRLVLLRLLGCSKAIVEDPVDAEGPFRLLLRSQPDFDLPGTMAPKIMGVFRKVQSEERALATQLRVLERNRIIEGLSLLGDVPTTWQGGRSLPLRFHLRDLTGVVNAVRFPYRRSGETVFSVIALQRQLSGEWVGAVPGDALANEQGLRLEYYVETSDEVGPLRTLGSSAAPRVLQVSPGQVLHERRPPLPRGVFIASASFTAAAGLAAAGLGLAFNVSQSSYQRQALVAAQAERSLDGALVARQAATGQALATGTTVTAFAALGAAVVTLGLIPFTRWVESSVDGP